MGQWGLRSVVESTAYEGSDTNTEYRRVGRKTAQEIASLVQKP